MYYDLEAIVLDRKSDINTNRSNTHTGKTITKMKQNLKNDDRKLLNSILLKLVEYRVTDNKEILEIHNYASKSKYEGFKYHKVLSKHMFALNIDIKAKRLLYFLDVLKSDGYILLELEKDSYSISKCHILENGIHFIENGGYSHWSKKWEGWFLRIKTIGGLLGIISFFISISAYVSTFKGKNDFNQLNDSITELRTEVINLKATFLKIDNVTEHQVMISNEHHYKSRDEYTGGFSMFSLDLNKNSTLKLKINVSKHIGKSHDEGELWSSDEIIVNGKWEKVNDSIIFTLNKPKDVIDSVFLGSGFEPEKNLMLKFSEELDTAFIYGMSCFLLNKNHIE